VRIVNAKGLGYAMSTSAELNLVKDVAESTGIILDPVYSGKALNGMLKDMAENPTNWEGKKVLFVHTGGLLGMYEKVVQLQPLLGKWERLRIPEFVMQPDDTKG
jgi:D-cysteine desulfhydrase